MKRKTAVAPKALGDLESAQKESLELLKKDPRSPTPFSPIFDFRFFSKFLIKAAENSLISTSVSINFHFCFHSFLSFNIPT